MDSFFLHIFHTQVTKICVNLITLKIHGRKKYKVSNEKEVEGSTPLNGVMSNTALNREVDSIKAI